MLEETTTTRIYFKAQGPAESRFDAELKDKDARNYSYDGWLPLTLSPADEDERMRATVLGDPWLTTPPGAKTRPGPGPAPVRISAAECSTELRERARLGLRYFKEETPEERGGTYDHDMVTENIAESASNARNEVDEGRSRLAALKHASGDQDRKRVARAEKQALDKSKRLQAILHAGERIKTFPKRTNATDYVIKAIRAALAIEEMHAPPEQPPSKPHGDDP